MSSKINITTFLMDGCHHCVEFKPEWEKLQKMIDNDKKYKNYSHNEYNAASIEAQNATINGEAIRGFPTIKLTLEKNGNKKEIDYMGTRRAKEITDFIEEQLKKL